MCNRTSTIYCLRYYFIIAALLVPCGALYSFDTNERPLKRVSYLGRAGQEALWSEPAARKRSRVKKRHEYKKAIWLIDLLYSLKATLARDIRSGMFSPEVCTEKRKVIFLTNKMLITIAGLTSRFKLRAGKEGKGKYHGALSRERLEKIDNLAKLFFAIEEKNATLVLLVYYAASPLEDDADKNDFFSAIASLTKNTDAKDKKIAAPDILRILMSESCRGYIYSESACSESRIDEFCYWIRAALKSASLPAIEKEEDFLKEYSRYVHAQHIAAQKKQAKANIKGACHV